MGELGCGWAPLEHGRFWCYCPKWPNTHQVAYSTLLVHKKEWTSIQQELATWGELGAPVRVPAKGSGHSLSLEPQPASTRPRLMPRPPANPPPPHSPQALPPQALPPPALPPPALQPRPIRPRPLYPRPLFRHPWNGLRAGSRI